MEKIFDKESKKEVSDKPKFVDKEKNPKKYVVLNPKYESYIVSFCENILDSTSNDVKLIECVFENDVEKFTSYLPNVLVTESELVFECMSDFVESIESGILYETGPLTVAQRRKKALLMKRHKSKILAAKKNASKHRADEKTLERRADRKARLMLKHKFTGKKSYNSMSPAQKLAIDKKMANLPKSVIDRTAQKMMSDVKHAETKRLQMSKSSSNKQKDDDGGFISKKVKTIAKNILKPKDNDTKKSVIKSTKMVSSVKEDVDLNKVFEEEFTKK